MIDSNVDLDRWWDLYQTRLISGLRDTIWPSVNHKTCMTTITYLKGDATSPQAKGVKLICHCL